MKKTYTQKQIEAINSLFPNTFDIEAGDEIYDFEIENEDDFSDEIGRYCLEAYALEPAVNGVLAIRKINTYSINCDGDLIDSEEEEVYHINFDGDISIVK